MYQLRGSLLPEKPLPSITKHLLVICDYRADKQAIASYIRDHLTYETKQVLTLGESMVSPTRLATFDTVLLWEPTQGISYWDIHRKAGYLDYIKQVCLSQKKWCIAVGEAGSIFLPRATQFLRGDIQKSKDLTTPHLAVFPHRAVFHYDITKLEKPLIRQLLAYSNRFPSESIWLFTDTLTYTSTTKTPSAPVSVIRHGTCYSYTSL